MSGKPAAKPPLVLPDAIASAQDLAAVILEIRQYAKWQAHNAVKQRVGARFKSGAGDIPRLSAAASQLLDDWSRTHDSGKQPGSRDLDELISALEVYKTKAPSLTITLAAPPTSDIKRLLTGWCRTNIAPGVLVNFSFNRSLLGGMVVRYGSRLFDWSFRRQILENSRHFPEALRNVR